MADDLPKGLPGKIAGKFGDKLTDKAIEKGLDWVVGIGVGGVVIAFVRTEWACITKPWCTVSGPSLGALIAVTVVTTGATLYLGLEWRKLRRKLRASKEKAPFQKITVEDERLKLRWFIRRPPREWREWRNMDVTLSPPALEQVLDGPFHAKPGCNAHLKVLPDLSPSGNYPPTFDEYCPQCGDRVFMAAGLFDNRRVAVPPVRVKALEELQRMELNGIKLEDRNLLDPPIILENPGYWKLMLLPPPPVIPTD